MKLIIIYDADNLQELYEEMYKEEKSEVEEKGKPLCINCGRKLVVSDSLYCYHCGINYPVNLKVKEPK